MNNEHLFFTFSTAVGALLGYLLHLGMSWKEWAKLSGNKGLTFKDFINGDVPGHVVGFLSVIATYFAVPELLSVSWIKDSLSLQLQVNYLAAFAIAFISQAIAIKLWNISRKINGDS